MGEIPDEPMPAASSLKIVESFSVEKMLESPVKEPVQKAKSPIRTPKPNKSPKISPFVEAKKVSKSPAVRATTPKSLAPSPTTTTPKSLAQGPRSSPTTSLKDSEVAASSSFPSLPIITEVVGSVSDVVDKDLVEGSSPIKVDQAPSDRPKSPNLSNGIPEVPISSPVVDSSKSEVFPSKPENQQKEIPVSKPYKPGPRSRTKPHIAPVRVESKTREALEVNNVASDPKEPVKTTMATENIEEPIPREAPKEIVEQPLSDACPEKEVIKYKPGPKSRKKYLVLKEKADDNASDKDVEAEKAAVGGSPKRKVDSLDGKESEVTKKQKIAKESPESADGKKEDSIEAIQEFIKNTDTVMEVDAAPPNQEALEKRRAKRPYQCPVCEGFFSNTWPRFTSGISFWHFPRRSIQFTPVRCFN